MYRIQEASKLTGVSRDMIRHYEKLHLLSPSREDNRYRLYSDEDLLKIVLIRFYSNMGIPLSTLTEHSRDGDVSMLTQDLAAQTERLELMQRQLATKTQAAKQTLESLRQYESAISYQIAPIETRYLYSRDRHPEEDYAKLCTRISDAGCFFQYYYLQTVEYRDGEASILSHDRGIMLYAPLPFHIPGLERLPGQHFYQSTVSVPPNHYFTHEEIRSHLIQAAAHSARTRYSVLTNQVFAPTSSHERCVVSIQIPLDTEAIASDAETP